MKKALKEVSAIAVCIPLFVVGWIALASMVPGFFILGLIFGKPIGFADNLETAMEKLLPALREAQRKDAK